MRWVIFHDAISSLLLRQMTVNSWSGNWAIAALVPHPPPVNCRRLSPRYWPGGELRRASGSFSLMEASASRTGAIPQERALSKELVEILPSRAGGCGRSSGPSGRGPRRTSSIRLRRPCTPWIATGARHRRRVCNGRPRAARRRALGSSSKKVRLMPSGSKTRLRANSARDCPLTRFTMSPSRKKSLPLYAIRRPRRERQRLLPGQ